MISLPCGKVAVPRPVPQDTYVVEDYKDKAGEDKSAWTRIGAAWPHKDGKGFNAELRALPVNGKLVIRRFESQ